MTGVETRSKPGRQSHPASGHPYSVLLPVGFTMPAALPRAAVRSYRTLSPLLPRPGPKTGCRFGGLLSVALSLGLPPAAVSRHRVSMEPGLSSIERGAGACPNDSGRPADW